MRGGFIFGIKVIFAPVTRFQYIISDIKNTVLVLINNK